MSYYNGPYDTSANMKKIGDYMGKIPHIEVGVKDDKAIFTKEEEDFIKKVKKWALIICIIAVIGYAAYRLLLA